MDVEPTAVTFHDLYQRYAPDVYRYALSLCRHPAEAEDIMAETFARCWSDFDQIRMPTVKSYLFTIARHLFFHDRRHRRRQVELDAGIEDRANLGERVEQKSEIETALRWLSNLSADDREIFLLRVRYDLSYEEIARIHGITVSSAKVKVHRARLKLIQWRRLQESS